MSVFAGFTFEPNAEIVPGTVPAWAVVFRDELTTREHTVGSDTYNGSVSATLPTGLNGGSYQIVFEGMTSEDYQRIRRPAGTRLSADLHLWWKDAPSGVLGGLARFTGLDNPLAATTSTPPDGSLVAKIRVERVWRRPGTRRIEVVVSARELVCAQLDEHRVEGRCFQVEGRRSSLEVAVTKVAEGIVPLVGHELDKAFPPADGTDHAAVPPGTALQAVQTLTQQVQSALGLYGLPIAMIRDGRLHVGEWTKSSAAPSLDLGRPMDDHTGLLDIERGEVAPRDVRLPAGIFGPRALRLTFAVTALGRPDLKPGDRVSLVLPPEDFTAVEPPSIGATLLTSEPNLPFGAIDPDAKASVCRIGEVTHQISREQGFITTFRATLLEGGDDGWDRSGGGPVRDAAQPRQAGAPFSDSAHGAASTVGAVVGDLIGRSMSASRTRPAVIHDHTVASGTPRHSSDIWYSDAAPDGFPGAAQRAAITEAAHAELVQVPYLTPFAWGNFGMVLPRYPGTRVVVANVGGGPGDFVDVGALWPRDTGPAARPGDYWLALPVSIPQREHLQDPEKQLPDDGPATHDLIDGDGTRILETARFVLRVTDQLTKVPNRPVPDDELGDGTVLIESKSGADGRSARIVLSGDGSVTITASSITFDTQGKGDIVLRAKDVKVELDGGTMDVS